MGKDTQFERRGDQYFDAVGNNITPLVLALREHEQHVRAGSKTSPAKRRAVRENGKLGGRPKGSKNKPKPQV
jgi:hypothetical protein